MKIRTGFVSNSSSSSFLVIYRDIDDFNRFSGFVELPSLVHDLSTSTVDKVFGFVKELILRDGYDSYYKYTSNYEDVHSTTSDFWEIQELVQLSGADDSKYCEWRGKISTAGFAFYREHDVANATYVYDKDWYRAYDAAWSDTISKDLDVIASELARDIVDRLSAGGYAAACVEYEDHDDYGCYMEHDFMPMIAADADHKISVITINNH